MYASETLADEVAHSSTRTGQDSDSSLVERGDFPTNESQISRLFSERNDQIGISQIMPLSDSSKVF